MIPTPPENNEKVHPNVTKGKATDSNISIHFDRPIGEGILVTILSIKTFVYCHGTLLPLHECIVFGNLN